MRPSSLHHHETSFCFKNNLGRLKSLSRESFHVGLLPLEFDTALAISGRLPTIDILDYHYFH